MFDGKGLAAALAMLTAAGGSFLSASCGKSAPQIIVGSKTSTEQMILGEIVAQRIEQRLQRKVERRQNVGNTLIAYQSLQSGEISLYPESSGAIVTDILREPPATDAGLVFERARGEMRRIAQSELFDPLGVNDQYVGVIRATDPRAPKVANLSQAAEVADPWKLGVTFDFQQRADGPPALNQYHLPMGAPVRGVETAQIFRSIEAGQVTMILTNGTDGPLATPDWKALPDDRKLFTPQEVCLLVRQTVLDAEPRLRSVLAELSGKISTAKMRQLNAQVDVSHRQVEDVARDFLAGLK